MADIFDGDIDANTIYETTRNMIRDSGGLDDDEGVWMVKDVFYIAETVSADGSKGRLWYGSGGPDGFALPLWSKLGLLETVKEIVKQDNLWEEEEENNS